MTEQTHRLLPAQCSMRCRDRDRHAWDLPCHKNHTPGREVSEIVYGIAALLVEKMRPVLERLKESEDKEKGTYYAPYRKAEEEKARLQRSNKSLRKDLEDRDELIQRQEATIMELSEDLDRAAQEWNNGPEIMLLRAINAELRGQLTGDPSEELMNAKARLNSLGQLLEAMETYDAGCQWIPRFREALLEEEEVDEW